MIRLLNVTPNKSVNVNKQVGVLFTTVLQMVWFPPPPHIDMNDIALD